MHSSTAKSMYTQWNHAVLCTMEPNASSYTAFKEMYDIISDAIDDVIKIEYWKVPPKHTILKISHRPVMHHSLCDTCTHTYMCPYVCENVYP